MYIYIYIYIPLIVSPWCIYRYILQCIYYNVYIPLSPWCTIYIYTVPLLSPR